MHAVESELISRGHTHADGTHSPTEIRSPVEVRSVDGEERRKSRRRSTRSSRRDSRRSGEHSHRSKKRKSRRHSQSKGEGGAETNAVSHPSVQQGSYGAPLLLLPPPPPPHTLQLPLPLYSQPAPVFSAPAITSAALSTQAQFMPRVMDGGLPLPHAGLSESGRTSMERARRSRSRSGGRLGGGGRGGDEGTHTISWS